MNSIRTASGVAAAATALALLFMTPAFAADIEAKSTIDAVTVYPDGATVTRLATVGLPQGASTIVLKGLPAALDASSLRVTGQGSASFGIGSVEVKQVPGETKSTANPELEAKIKALTAGKEALEAQLQAAEGKRDMIKRYAAASPEKLGPEAKPLDVAQWAGAWEMVGSALAKTNEEIRVVALRVKDIGKEIETLEEAQPDEADPGQPKQNVIVAVDTKLALEGSLALSYRVTGAKWRPIYDARLDTGGKGGKPSLELIRRAQITQTTGEDWANVALAVSTVSVARGTGAPELRASQVAFYEPPRPVLRSPAAAPSYQRQLSVESNAKSRVLAVDKMAEADAKKPDEEAEEQQASLEAGGFQASFAVPGRVSVQQDGSPKAFRLSSRNVAPALTVKSVPVIDEAAYLEASFVNEDEAALLPGEIAIHRDDTFVGRGRVGLVAPGDKVELGFGSDERVKVTRVPLRRAQEEPGVFSSSKTDQREFKTTVKNLHTFPVKVTIIDRVPFSENAAIIVEMLSQSTAPTEKVVKDRRGVMAWTYDYAAGEQKEIRLAYRVKWPAEKEIAVDGRPQR
jgi:uncharacterized protein (TIGR02231 family)